MWKVITDYTFTAGTFRRKRERTRSGQFSVFDVLLRQVEQRISLIFAALLQYRKIPKIKSRGLYFSKALFERLVFGGASLIVGRKFTVFALFYLVFEGNFQVQAPGGLIFGGAIYREFGGLIFGGAYFRNFTVFPQSCF